MVINVTQEHIDTGQRRRPMHCPVALAVKVLYPDLKVRVLPSMFVPCLWFLYIGNNVYPLPSEICRIITNYDCGRTIEPFTFAINE